VSGVLAHCPFALLPLANDLAIITRKAPFIFLAKPNERGTQK
jgi:hypothetical protein